MADFTMPDRKFLTPKRVWRGFAAMQNVFALFWMNRRVNLSGDAAWSAMLDAFLRKVKE